MLNENIETQDYYDFNPRLNTALDSLNYKILVELGYKGFPWSLLYKTSFSEGLPDYKTYRRIATGTARTIGDAFYDAIKAMSEEENNEELFWELLRLA